MRLTSVICKLLETLIRAYMAEITKWADDGSAVGIIF